MREYKITSKTGKSVILTEEQKDTFFEKNKIWKDGEWQYRITNLTREKNARINKMLDALSYLCIIGASILATLLYIENYC